jgi:hypothetical protein
VDSITKEFVLFLQEHVACVDSSLCEETDARENRSKLKAPAAAGSNR